MALPRSRPVRRRRAVRRKTTRPRRMMRRKGASNETASCKEIYSIRGLLSNNMYSDQEQQLADYKRASAIAQNYQFFRIKYIKYKFIARYNTFQATTAELNAFPIPQFYSRLDKGGSLPTNTGINQLKQMGSRPTRFTKDITLMWKPGVSFVTENNSAANQYGTAPKISPWLITNRQVEQLTFAPNDTDHKGLYWYVETAGLPGDGTYEYDADIEIMFEFKNPLSVLDEASPLATSAKTMRQVQTPPLTS